MAENKTKQNSPFEELVPIFREGEGDVEIQGTSGTLAPEGQ